MKFSIHLSSTSQKFLKKANDETYSRIIKKLKEIADDPFPPDVKRVVGRKEKLFRVRVGDYRILYVVYLDKKAVLIVNVDKRSMVYKK